MSRTNLLLTLTLAVAGCGSTAPDEFSSAARTRSAISIDVPGGGGSTTASAGESQEALIGARAQLYTFTRDVSRAVNDGVGDILGRIELITDHPPSQRDANKASWGPMTSALDPAEYTLVVERTAPHQFNYVLAGKPKGADDSQERPLLAGHASVVDETHGSGDLLVDFSAMKVLDPTRKAEGGIAVHYDNTSNPRNVEVLFHNFTDQPGAQPNDAAYRYAEHPDHSGNFEFVTLADVDHDGATLEVLGVLSRWDATGAGRSDATATGGSLGGLTVHVEECWGASFGRTYYTDNLSINPTEGDPKSCVF
jgi:hypothetical protein